MASETHVPAGVPAPATRQLPGEAQTRRTIAQAIESTEDLAHGQVVIITFRWILVASGLVLSIWNPAQVGELRVQILFILMLAGANFYLLAQLLLGRKVLAPVVYAASASDLLVVTLLAAVQGGFESSVYIFYLPAILVYAVAFPTWTTALYTIGVIGVYGLLALITAPLNEGSLQVILVRLIMFAAMATCGNLYLRIERTRREAASKAHEELLAQLQKKRTAQGAQS